MLVAYLTTSYGGEKIDSIDKNIIDNQKIISFQGIWGIYKGDESKCCHFFVISFIALLIHFGIVALIFKDHYIIFLCDTAGVLLYSVYIDFDILTIIEKYDVDEYTLASIRLTLDTFGMFSVLTSGNSTSRRARRRHYGKRFHGFRF